jgi:DNA-binding MarR family transcriptional regulator
MLGRKIQKQVPVGYLEKQVPVTNPGFRDRQDDENVSVNSDEGLDAVLGWNAVKVARIIGGRITAQLDAHDVSLVQFGVLSCLDGGAEMTSADIARAVFVRPQTMSQVLDGMEDRGLIRRVGVRAKGQRNPVRITPAGELALTAAQSIALGTNDLTDLGLSAAESQKLNDLLLTVIQAAGDEQ